MPHHSLALINARTAQPFVAYGTTQPDVATNFTHHMLEQVHLTSLWPDLPAATEGGFHGTSHVHEHMRKCALDRTTGSMRLVDVSPFSQTQLEGMNPRTRKSSIIGQRLEDFTLPRTFHADPSELIKLQI